MKRSINTININDAAEFYAKGVTLAATAIEFGVNPDALSKAFKAIGVDVQRTGRAVAHNRIELPIDEIITMYQSGRSENSIAKHFGVVRSVIRRVITEAGLEARTQSEAEKIKWAQMTLEQRANQVKSAHESTSGTPTTFEHRCKIALAREKLMADHHIGIGEPEFREYLVENQIHFLYQKAIDTYNVDFLIGNVAVELTTFGGRYRWYRTAQNERVKNLLKRGYKTLAVEFDSAETLINFADNIITYVNRISRCDTDTAKYWVVRCSRHDTTVIQNNLGQFTCVKVPEYFKEKWESIDL